MQAQCCFERKLSTTSFRNPACSFCTTWSSPKSEKPGECPSCGKLAGNHASSRLFFLLSFLFVTYKLPSFVTVCDFLFNRIALKHDPKSSITYSWRHVFPCYRHYHFWNFSCQPYRDCAQRFFYKGQSLYYVFCMQARVMVMNQNTFVTLLDLDSCICTWLHPFGNFLGAKKGPPSKPRKHKTLSNLKKKMTETQSLST